MITQAEFQLAAEAAEEADRDLSGVRRVCMCCQAELPGSNRNALRTSHGLCAPACEPARKMGWVRPEERNDS